MKKLIISMKSTNKMMDDFVDTFNKIKDGKKSKNHYEISFESQKDFNRFAQNFPVIQAIALHKPNSIYELSQILGKNESNIRRIVSFLNDVGVIELIEEVRNGRKVLRPVANYNKIELDLLAA